MEYDNVWGLLRVRIYQCDDLRPCSVIFPVSSERSWGIDLECSPYS